MPNTIDANGLTVNTRAELLAYWTAQFQAIYGADVNLASDSPDGQLMNIVIQAQLDQQDLLVQLNASFDPDQAIGVALRQRVAINGLQGQGGTYSVTNITVVTDRAVSLVGLDALSVNPNAQVFTIADDAGTQWQLQTSIPIAAPVSPATTVTSVLVFQAVKPGATQTLVNTITVPVTIALGVVSVNNPTQLTTLGLEEETDSALRIRRQKSVSINSQGYHDALVALLENISGVTYAKVYENNSGQTSDGTTPAGIPAGIPRNCIWVVIDGTGLAASIAQAIYSKRNAGCAMKGAQTQTITQKDNTPFVVKWDTVAKENLYIQFDAQSINGIDAIDAAYIAAQLAATYNPGIAATVDSTSLGTAVQAIDSNCLVTGAQFSLDGSTWASLLAPSAANNQFAVAASRIDITVE